MSRTSTSLLGALLLATLIATTACGGDDDAGDDDSGGPDAGVSIDVPADATFCSIFSGQYRFALDAAVPATDAGFADAAATITAWAEAMRDLAPPEIADEANDNVGYHRAQQNKQSASDFIADSNAMHEWANTNC